MRPYAARMPRRFAENAADMWREHVIDACAGLGRWSPVALLRGVTHVQPPLASESSERLEVFHQITLLRRRQPERHVLVVVRDDVGERREAAVVVETALLV